MDCIALPLTLESTARFSKYKTGTCEKVERVHRTTARCRYRTISRLLVTTPPINATPTWNRLFTISFFFLNNFYYWKNSFLGTDTFSCLWFYYLFSPNDLTTFVPLVNKAQWNIVIKSGLAWMKMWLKNFKLENSQPVGKLFSDIFQLGSILSK